MLTGRVRGRMVVVTQAFSAADVRAAERGLLAAERAFDGGLMHRAAWALATTVRRELVAARGRVAGASVVGLVGSGNNGGDTLHALALLAAHGVQVTAVASGPVHEGGLAALGAARGAVLGIGPGAPGEPVWLGEAVALAFAADVVLDGLLGIGARGGLRDTPARLVELLTALTGAAPGRSTRPLVVAVDVPSGIGVDDGALPGPVLPADLTVTFGAVKPGLLLPPAAPAVVGRLELVDLGLAPELADLAATPVVTSPSLAEVGTAWPVPAQGDHKYSRGVLGVVAGSAAYTGAAVLTVAGALGAGVGMVRYLGPDAVGRAVVAAHPEVVPGDGRVQAWVLGPGVADAAQLDRVRAVLARTGDDPTPVVVDAGALAVLPRLVGPHVVLTPHAGELATLLQRRGLAVERAQVEAEPWRWASEAQAATGATVVLKGAVTLVASSAGVTAHDQAPAWLATAGAGDVLAGVLGAVLAGGAAADDVAGAVAAGVVAHGTAAQLAGADRPLRASAVAAALPAAVARLLAAARGMGD